ncbi:MAG: cation diffusion facilitator family transporter [Mycobacterium leprae]
MTEDRQHLINRAGMITIGCNVILTTARAIAAVHSGSTAVLADAANSGTDIFATLVVMGGSRIAAMPPDINHPYGHYKAEPVAAKLVGVLVTITGVLAATAAWHALQAERTEPVGLVAAWVTGISIVVKEILARFLIRTAKRTGNSALEADGANQRTDVLASIAALVGALGGRFGLSALDPAMAILVAGLILRMGIGLYWRSVNDLMDPAPDPLVMSRIRFVASGVAGVQQVDEVKARLFGSGIYVDCKIAVDCMLTVEAGHRIAGRVKRAIREAVPETLGVLVHVNPGRPVHVGPARRLVRSPRNVL